MSHKPYGAYCIGNGEEQCQGMPQIGRGSFYNGCRGLGKCNSVRNTERASRVVRTALS